jgi:hypothetical protein
MVKDSLLGGLLANTSVVDLHDYTRPILALGKHAQEPKICLMAYTPPGTHAANLLSRLLGGTEKSFPSALSCKHICPLACATL